MTTTVDIVCDPILVAIEPYVSVEPVIDADIRWAEPVVTTDVEPWVVLDGIGVPEGEYYGVAALQAAVLVPEFTPGFLLPQNIFDELDPYVRFLPIVGQQTVDGTGRHILMPQGATLSDQKWFLHLKTHVGDDDGTDTFTWDAHSPHVDSGYTYRGHGIEQPRKAVVFDGEVSLATLARQSGPSTFAQLTVAFVAVLHPGSFDYYPIFEWLGTEDSYTQLRHAHGRVSLVKDHVELVAHESTNSAAQASIVMVAFDGDNDIGRFSVIDRGRTSTEFSMVGLTYAGLTGTVGAARTRVFWPHEGYDRFGDLDLLDLVVWDTALTLAQMEQKAALLGACYGVQL